VVRKVQSLWCALAEETVTGLSAQVVEGLPALLKTLTGNVDTRTKGAEGDLP
jgi:hypothetical protein